MKSSTNLRQSHKNAVSGQKLRNVPLSIAGRYPNVTGLVKGMPVLDLEYVEDSVADTDMNVVITEDGRFIEIQGTAEDEPFDREELMEMLRLAEKGASELQKIQRAALAED